MLIRLLLFFFYYLRELIIANYHIARDVLSPTPPFHPGFVYVPTDGLSPFAQLCLANLITMTPGTLVVDVRGGSFLVHLIYEGGEESLKNDFLPHYRKLFSTGGKC